MTTQARPEMRSDTPAYRERVIQFGPDRGLVGILSLGTERGNADRPAVVLINSGIIHRVGSNRLYVELARALAAAGVPALRFDLSGIGDSARRTDVVSIRESVERDVAAAVDYLASVRPSDRVVLMGLCSGAFDAFSYALRDPRVVGAYIVDMPGPFRDWAHTFRHIMGRLLRPSSWRNPLRSLFAHSRTLVEDASRNTGSGVYVVGARSAASRQRMHEQLKTLLGRGVRLHFTFTAGLEANYNHPQQFRSTFPKAARHPRVSYDFFPERDHSFGTRDMRERLIQRAVTRLLSAPPSLATVRDALR